MASQHFLCNFITYSNLAQAVIARPLRGRGNLACAKILDLYETIP
jgi:hypothetical protein